MQSWRDFLKDLSRSIRDVVDVERMRQSSVLVLGCGAVGSFLSEILARALIGRATLWDLDDVSPPNLARSSYDTRHLNDPKALCLAGELKTINPLLKVRSVEGDILKASDDQIVSLALNHDLTIVAADNFRVHDRLNTLLHQVTELVFTYVTDRGRMGEIVRTTPHTPGCIRCLVNFEERLNAGVARDFQALGIDMLHVATEAARTVLGILLRDVTTGERFSGYVNEDSKLLLVLNGPNTGFEQALPDGFVSGTLRVDTSDIWPGCPICQSPE